MSRSRKELFDRLLKDGFPALAIEKVLADLERVKLIDDLEFALIFSRSQVVTRPCGEILLRRELALKGVTEEYINAGISEAYKEKSQKEIAVTLARKKKKTSQNMDERKAKKRVADFLARRGFKWDIVNDIIDQWDEI